ncbi:putative FAD-binding domain, FAD/NAD(P)-binding domain-containing protein [Rosa chinensis]|uniref:Putative FAD-binding domain, FAD/NAD(P)-binding domain-containing protein n=1 Tax=Rosa chinensis TaxID=74649 RepID=A0A2P6PSW2_ROSCH|nr:monooxygenase 3 [Rosa chinensis]PRQ24991.1 putative FAD-binding domain, FAD/NAD(P)-binding domain-containing protein [Rosa chinensis]
MVLGYIFVLCLITMEVVEDVVIVGAGIAGLTTSLGLHRLGIRSLVLESADSLRVTGFALAIWTNAWRALDALGIGNDIRQQHQALHGNVAFSRISGLRMFEKSYDVKGKLGDHEVYCVKRKLLLETIARELPNGTIRFSSKVVSIEESGYFKRVHLADGTILKAKVLVGCDGVNSVVAKWLGFKKPVFKGRSAVRGCADFNSSHGFDPKFMQYFGNGIKTGTIPCDDKTVYWFFGWYPSSQEEELKKNPAQLKQYMLSKLGKVSDEARAVVENTDLDAFRAAPVTYRHPWDLLWGNISKGNVCVAGDALHPMVPDIGQGGCAALEDGVVLARFLGEALLKNQEQENKDKGEEGKEKYKRIEMGLNKYASERKWRSIDLTSTSSVVSYIQVTDGGKITAFLRDKIFAPFLTWLLFKKADYDCGKLRSP